MSKITPIENGTISRDNQSDCQSCWYFYGYTRFVVMIIVSACLTLLYSNPITLNFTVICMKDVIDNRTGIFDGVKTRPTFHFLKADLMMILIVFKK